MDETHHAGEGLLAPSVDPLDLIAQLKLEPIEVNLFRGLGPRDNGGHFFGGHVIAQALLAAYGTVEGRVCHSLHAYFIRPGDVTIPVLYEVDRARDGGSFTTRRVTAIQHGRQIFNLACSFQAHEAGLEHQAAMPPAPAPESLPQRLRAPTDRVWTIDLRRPDPPSAAATAPKKAVWLRAKRPIGPEIAHQQAVLAYASDMAFMETALRPHALVFDSPGMQTASLDHALWFHHPTDMHGWHLYDQDSPVAVGGRGLVRGQMFDVAGRLIASVAQEALMRMRKPKPPAPSSADLDAASAG